MPDFEATIKFEEAAFSSLEAFGLPGNPDDLIGSKIYVDVTTNAARNEGFLTTVTGLSRAPLGFLIHLNQRSVMGLGLVLFLMRSTGRNKQWKLVTQRNQEAKDPADWDWHICTISPKWPT